MLDATQVTVLHAKRVSWIELFFDLVFVAAVGQVGHPLEHASGPGAVFRQVLLLVLIWSAWHGYVGYATRFDPDTLRARTCTLLQMVCVVFMAANADDEIWSVSTAGFVVAYGAMRLLLAVQFAGVACAPAQQTLVRAWRRGLVLGGMVWIVSALLPVPLRYAMWVVAAGVDVWLERASFRAALEAPPHADHLPERFGLFTLILLGEALVAIMRGIQGQPMWSVPAASAALGSLAGVFGIWWAYFGRAHATARRPVATVADVRRLAVWTYAHLPLYLGITFLGVDAESLVRAGGHVTELGGFAATAALAAGLVLLGLAGVRTPQRLRPPAGP